MTAHSVSVSGERLSEFLRQPPDLLAEVEVTSSPPSWPPLKPLLAQLVRSYRERGLEPPVFSGVPLCLFGSEWSGFKSLPRTTPARGRCAPCQARQSCGFREEVPDELLSGRDRQRCRDGLYAVRGADHGGVSRPGDSRAVSPVVRYRGAVGAACRLPASHRARRGRRSGISRRARLRARSADRGRHRPLRRPHAGSGVAAAAADARRHGGPRRIVAPEGLSASRGQDACREAGGSRCALMQWRDHGSRFPVRSADAGPGAR
jgi:hypothetical protein